MDTTSYWTDSISLPRAKKISKDCEVDVVVIGGGITGVTAAYLLKKSGARVALLERGRCGGFDTANTTAHLTSVTDTHLPKLVSRFGKENARAVWDAGRAAIDQIFNNIRSEKIDCDFKWIPGFLHAPLDEKKVSARDAKEFQREAALANELGFATEFLESVPFVNRPGVKVLHQAKFHPLKYLAALLKKIPGNGSYVFEHSAADDFQKSPLAVKVGKNKIRCSYLILATHTPLMGKSSLPSATLFQSKLFLYSSYALGAKIPSGIAPEASFWDTDNPYFYLRIDKKKNFDYAILGGEDHKTGQRSEKIAYANLEKMFRKLFPRAEIDHRWSGQVIETPDGLPFIGETAPRQFAATGFSGNGMTFGTLAAMMAVDAFHKRKNPWAKLFDVHRKKIRDGAWTYLTENKDYPYYMIRDWLARGEKKSLSAVPRNGGKILQLHGKKVAAYRDADGKVSLCSPVCTHLQCIVEWNDAEKTWDCPCHGSRFAPTGKVLSGPAEEPLEKIEN